MALKDDIDYTITLIEGIAEKIDSGEVETIAGYIALKKIEKALKGALKEAGSTAIDTLTSRSSKELSQLPFGASGQVKSTKKYMYTENELYLSQATKLEKLKELIEIATDKNTGIADEDGEMIYGVKVQTSTTCAISF